jgi:hypothetical protein
LAKGALRGTRKAHKRIQQAIKVLNLKHILSITFNQIPITRNNRI